MFSQSEALVESKAVIAINVDEVHSESVVPGVGQCVNVHQSQPVLLA